MRTWLPIAHLALTLIILAWDIALAGRISQVRKAPRAFAAITALAGFLIAPALALSIAASSAITGRALIAVDWLWPLTDFLVSSLLIGVLFAVTYRFMSDGQVYYRHVWGGAAVAAPYVRLGGVAGG